MSGWVAPPIQAPGVQLPPGIQVASMGRRLGAWMLDRLLAGLLAIIPAVVAIVTGGVALNRQALDQFGQLEPYSSQPFAHITAPLFNVNTGPLVLAAVVFVALNAAYYAGCWVKFGATPCQRGLDLRVADVASGDNLSIGRALVRWALLEGLAECIGAVFLVLFLNALAGIPTNEWLGGGAYNFYGSAAGIGLASSLVSGVSGLWLIVLIVSAGTHPDRLGIHDRLVGSIVVEPVRAAAGWPGYPPQGAAYLPQGAAYPPQAWPGYPPQGAAYPPQAWPGYPPQGAPYWPPQGLAYPPQGAPYWPPQAAPYPPQAGPHPPQATPVPPAPDDQPAGKPPDTGPGQ